jgi:hypothetical protein
MKYAISLRNEAMTTAIDTAMNRTPNALRVSTVDFVIPLVYLQLI